MELNITHDVLSLSNVQLTTPLEENNTYYNLALRVQRCIELGTAVDGINILPNVNFSPLITAALYKDPKLVEWLLERGASRNVSTESYRSPFHAVLHIPRIQNDNPDHIEKFVTFYQEQLPYTQEAIIIAQLLGERPLITAAQDNNLLLARRCLAYGLNPNAQDDCGRTALMCAVENNANDIVRALFEYGVDIRITDNNARTAADYAKRNFDRELKKQLTVTPAFTHTGVPLHYLSATPEEISFAAEVHQNFALWEFASQLTDIPLPTAPAKPTRLVVKEKPKRPSRTKTVKRSTHKDNEDDEEFILEDESSQERISPNGFNQPELIKSFKKKRSKKKV